ncbi:prolyl oligopeptidase family serine peptidase [Flavihumibacter fluvii]|uniref:carboxylesterase family protein n=1 Tax=Flavihumibacter fluvii TaxID=2838157 RepID=UPI001BDEE233|nr:prolyl oligopeptidase family serine peptidase [Flavihumibacter fluvii]ULQ54231.1 prolyl oligopeptidase family serine peptidase [Flavihumibacter fluvii]
MRSCLLIFFLCTALLRESYAQDLSLFEKKVFVSTKGDTLLYRILYPENYDRSKTYPLVMFLHGAGERGNDNEAQLMHGSKLFLADSNRKNFPAIVVFPQCPLNIAWSSVNVDRTKQPLEFRFDYKQPQTAPMRSVLALTQELIASESVNKKRVYITGLSMGGMGTFEAVYHMPALFAAAAPICGGGDGASYNRKTAKVPFWIFHGDADPVVNAQLSRDMVERLKKLKGKVKYSEYPGVGHNSWDNAFAEPGFLAWMFAQSK